MIAVNQISKSYGNISALDQVSLIIPRGVITGILGPNGAGKTTLFKILTGLIKPSSGVYSIDSQRAKKIGAVIENPHLYEYLNAQDNLRVLAKYQNLSLKTTEVNHLLTLVGLDINRTDPVKNYSLGMKQRLGIATALLNEPEALILDEPFLGLDPLGMQDLRTLLTKLSREKKMAILLSSHQLDELSKVCEHLYLLNKGKIISDGPTLEILHKATLKFRISGKQIGEAAILENFQTERIGDAVLIEATKIQIHEVIKGLVSSGYQIDEFGPEINLEDIYQSK